ncbi:carboxymuconolactone decarboxylase family protein [Modestobacter italicus]|uniref:carboxymuconolactone decarboxylase family protein n=1 Tax=Modestobacter italicus (strain DSM 44449 / CECT 9708 / BC 501) TaxID=2732864 RepID=UPI001C984108|nr:carboxymuconolactone decarboxylase family protein [Modestobacter italicus]
MSWIDTPVESPATSTAAQAHTSGEAAPGAVPNHARVFAQRPAVLAAWQQLNAAVKAGMDPRRYELATVAAAVRMRCSYCALAHGQVLAEQHLGAEAVVAMVRDPRSAGLSATELAVVELADQVAAGAAAMTEADVARARAAGLSDGDVLDVVLAAAARLFFSSVLDAVGALPDGSYAALPAHLRDALTVGRPIESDEPR